MAVEFTEEQLTETFDRIASGEAVNQIFPVGSRPSQTEFYRLLNRDDSIQERYTRAKAKQADVFLEQITEIADGIEDPKHVEMAKVRIESRKWVMGKMRPKKYGTTPNEEKSGDGSTRIIVEYAGKGDD